MGHNRNGLYSRAIHSPASMEKHYVQWFILKSVYEITDCGKKLDFPFLSLGRPSHGARVWCLGRVPKHRNHLLPQGSESRAVGPGGKMNKETTAFIQGPSIVLPVWRCIMFNDSYLRACMKLWIVQKNRFSLLSLGGPRHGARVWCLGRVPKHRKQGQEVEGLLFSTKNSLLVHILSFHS